MPKKRTKAELAAIEARFKVSLGEPPFTFMIGNTRQRVTRVGLATMNEQPVLMVIGVSLALFREAADEDRRERIEAIRLIEIPHEFEGVRVDVWNDE